MLEGSVPDVRLDAKGRLQLGAKFKTVLGDRAIMFKDDHPCLNIFPVERFREYESRLQVMAEANGTTHLPRFSGGWLRDYLREVYSHYAEVDVDDQGRITVPKFLRDTALLEGPLTVKSTGYFLEIWRIEDLGKYKAERAARPALPPEAYGGNPLIHPSSDVPVD